MKRSLLWLLVYLFAGMSALSHAEPQTEDAAALLSRMAARAAQLQDYTVKGEGEANGKPNRFKFSFKQPDLVRIDTRRGQVTVEPNGEIRGRRGHGLFGRFSRRLRRDDPRLKDAAGIPFWGSSYAATIARIQSQIKAGATAALTATPEGYHLEIRSGQTVWGYVIDPETLFFRETSLSQGGKQVSVTRYSEFHPNGGLKNRIFEF